MPLYEYKCTACGQYCEKLEKVDAKHSTDCPYCQQPKLERQVSAAAFHLKGSGWYVTDFRDKDNKKSDNKNGSSKDSAKTQPEATKTDTATATKETTSKDSKKNEAPD